MVIDGDLRIILLGICAIAAFVCAAVVIAAVLIQPSNSRGISALGGSADTFYNKSKGKSLASTMKIVTYIGMGLVAFFMMAFYFLYAIVTAA